MADQSAVRQNWGSYFMAATERFMAAYEEMVDLDTKATSAGLIFTDGDFTGTAIRQLDATVIANARAMLGQITTYLNGTPQGGTGQRKDVFNKLRP